jgi:hypothetical protein
LRSFQFLPHTTQVDLAAPKISRYSPQDREDILALASAGLFSANQLKERATGSLTDYIGDRTPVITSFELICREIDIAKSQQVAREINDRELGF